MLKNQGKLFENDFKTSVPDNVVFIRLKDAGGWSKSQDLRFTPKNECDAIMYKNPNIYLLEFKSHKGKSLPFSCISDKQAQSLNDLSKYEGVISGYIVNFRDLEATYFVYADDVMDYMMYSDRSSIPVAWCELKGIKINQFKKRTRYAYDVESFVKSF